MGNRKTEIALTAIAAFTAMFLLLNSKCAKEKASDIITDPMEEIREPKK